MAEADKPMGRGQVARQLGVRPDTVTLWARKGLIEFTLTKGGHMRFTQAEVERLRADLPKEHPQLRVGARSRVDTPEGYNVSAAQLGEAIGRSHAWVARYANAGLLPGKQVPHPTVAGRTAWRFNLEEAREAIAVNPELWGMQGGAGGERSPVAPPDQHHTLTTEALALKLGKSPGAVRNWATMGIVPVVVVGRRRWFNLEDVLRALAEREARPRKDKGHPHATDPPDDHHTLRGDEVAAATGFAAGTLKRWAAEGVVPAVFHRVRYWFNLDEVFDALLRTGRLVRSEPVHHTVPYEQYTLSIGQAAAAVGIHKNRLVKLLGSGLVPYAISAEGHRVFYLPDLQESLRRNPHLLSRESGGTSPREDPRHTTGPPVEPLMPFAGGLDVERHPLAPDDRHTMTAAAAAEHAQQQTLPPGKSLPWMDESIVRDWAQGRVVSGVKHCGALWVNPDEVTYILRQLVSPHGSATPLLSGTLERNPVDEAQVLRLRRLRSRRDQLMQRLAEVNAEIDEVTDGSAQEQLVDVSPPDWGELINYLRELHLEAGKPSARKVAEGSGRMVSHTTVSEVLRGARVPSWKSLWVIGKQLGADEDTLKGIWLHCQIRLPEEGGPTSLLAGRPLLISYVASQGS
jgi:DNA-binding transcriptional MerR regulator